MRNTRHRRRWVQRILLAMLAAVVAILVAVGGYLGYAGIRHTRPVTLPAPTGPYRVGRAMYDWTDTARVDPLHPSTHRELSVWLWYPAARHATGRAAAYLPGAWAGIHFSGVAGWGETSFAKVRDHALVGVPVAAGRFPIVVLEPGLGFAAPQYATIAEDIASHGYLVAGVTPTYSANLTVLGGHVVHANAAGNPAAAGEGNEHAGEAQRAADRLVAIWAADARFAAARVAGVATVAGHVDTAHTAYVGHSFGGAASLSACADDPHCAGAANLDGTQFGTVVRTGVDHPTLTLGSDDSCVTGTCHATSAADRADVAVARRLFAAGTGPNLCYRISGMRHFNFSDYGAYWLAAPLRALLALGSIDGNRGLAVAAGYLDAFLDHAVRGAPFTAHYPEGHQDRC